MINRIPGIDILCRKVPMNIIYEKIQTIFPSLYNFMPKTLVLPRDKDTFLKILKNSNVPYIIKPDGGSLGAGISIVDPGEEFSVPENGLYVAQEYIESFLIDNTKFDLRVYVLVASVDPLIVYVYKDGLARFAFDSIDKDTLFSKLTNVSLNKEREGVDYSKVSRLISEVRPILEKMGIEFDILWCEIENIILKTIISSHNYLREAQRSQCPKIGYSRCFQILGFDILIDSNLKPWVIEVNCRPSFKFHRNCERRMKVQMIKDSIRLAAPMDSVQAALNSRRWSWNRREWATFINNNKSIAYDVEIRRRNTIKTTNYRQIWPKYGTNLYDKVLNAVDATTLESIPGYTNPGVSQRGAEA